MLAEVINEYDFSGYITASQAELLALEQQVPTRGIIKLDKMARFIEMINKIRSYNNIDCDCGKRRNKRDKSIYVIGYRLHTLTAIDARTGHCFPIVSLLVPAIHHDSHFLPFLVNLAQAMGIDLQLITADEAYHDKGGTLFQETGVAVTTPPSSKVSLPEHINDDTGDIFCHRACSIPMHHLGALKQNHEYKCSADSDECTLARNAVLSRRMADYFSGFLTMLTGYEKLMISVKTVKDRLIY